jgi:tetratricopeptide (TPR) repeat protein
MTEEPFRYLQGPDRRTPLERMLDDVKAAIREERIEDARGTAARMIEIAPTHAPSWAANGMAHRAAQENDRALPCFHEAVRLDRKLWSAWAGLSDAYADLGQNEMALEASREGAAVAPEEAAMRAHYAGALARMDRYAEALTEIEAALRLAPGLRDYRRLLARILRCSGRYREAIDVLEQVRLESKKDVGFWGQDLAVLHLLVGDHRAAAWVLGKMHERSPLGLVFRATFRLFVGLYANPKDGAARLKTFLDETELHSRIAAAGWYEAGTAFACAQELDPAITAFEKADRLQPDWKEVGAEDLRIELGRAYAARQRTAEAIAALRSATWICPQSSRAWALLGEQLGHAGLFDEAVEAMRKVPELNPDVPAIWFNIGRL